MASIAAQENTSGLVGISNVYAAPVRGAACNAAYQSTVFIPQPCQQAHQSVFGNFQTPINLGSTVVAAFANPSGSTRVFLLPAGSNGCVAVKTESFF